MEQKETIAELKFENQELTASQRPPVEPEKRKVKIVEAEIDRNEICKDVIAQFNNLKEQCTQCAYQLNYYQQKDKVLQSLQTKKEPNGEGDKN